VGRRRLIAWNADFTAGTGPDGTRYSLNSEDLHHEPKWWDAEYAEGETFNEARVSRDWKEVPVGDCGHTKMGQVARCERYARQRQEACDG
jgi:hypothetical protein